MLSLLFFVVGVVMVYFAVMGFKRGGAKRLSPWVFLTMGLGNMGVLPRVLIPVSIGLWLIDLFKNRSRQFR